MEVHAQNVYTAIAQLDEATSLREMAQRPRSVTAEDLTLPPSLSRPLSTNLNARPSVAPLAIDFLVDIRRLIFSPFASVVSDYHYHSVLISMNVQLEW